MSTPQSLDVHLYTDTDQIPSSLGISVNALGGATARLRISETGTALHIVLPQRSRAEQRWIVDKLIRSVHAMTPVGTINLRATTQLSHETLRTIALDAYHRTQGAVTLPDHDEIADDVARIGSYEALYRAWVNEDATTRTSIAIANDIMSFAASRDDVEVSILEEEALRKHQLNLLLAVGQGADISPARLVIARYKPADQRPPLMLLGKGITFDSGGINVKPYASFVSMMKNDMAGAALAYSLFHALVTAAHDEPLLLIIPTCENAIGARAMKPGAVVKSHRGLYVRIDHTDAEGRLVLADGLAYASHKYAPRQILCFATLTTAALNAYGPYATPVHFADDALTTRLTDAAAATGEDLHFFPERIWHLEANRDKEADIRNTARLPGDASRAAGSRNAAHFLRHFTDLPLVHFDIFASTWNWSGEAPGAGYGATGAPLRTLLYALTD